MALNRTFNARADYVPVARSGMFGKVMTLRFGYRVSKHFFAYREGFTSQIDKVGYWHLIHIPTGYSMGPQFPYLWQTQTLAVNLEALRDTPWSSDDKNDLRPYRELFESVINLFKKEWKI